jgi:DNA polymerase-3 subunit beta
LTGVLFILDKDLLTLVATDGFRLSRKKIHLKNEKAGRVIVPKSVLGEVQKLIQESSEVVFSVEDKDKQVLFGTGDTILTSRVIEGDFPDFEKIIPQSFSISVLTDKEDFLRAVKLASIFARESANIVKLRLGKDFIGVFAESSASGSQETKVDAKVEGDLGQGFEIAFNYRFLEEFLHSSGGEDVGIEFTTSDKAGVFKDLSDTDHLHLIMPVRLQG